MARNLIIDGQILQTNAWYRGMGKYTLQLLQELSRTASKELSLHVIFNSSLNCDNTRFETVKYLCPNINQFVCHLPIPIEGARESKAYKAQLTRCIDAELGKEDNYYLITALFHFDFFADYPDNAHNFLLFYDLTPLLLWCDLGGYFPPDLYMQRFQRILEADRILSISDTTRKDLIKVFGLPHNLIVNINGGFTKIAENSIRPKSFKVPRRYLLFPTGDLPHKNNEIAIKGFQEYRDRYEKDIYLLVTSHFSDQSITHLKSFSNNLIFTGNVTDEELAWLYAHAEGMLFASKYEGLGMPILDAVADRKPIITSRIPVFEEMSSRAFHYFNPHDPQEVAAAIHSALQSGIGHVEEQQYDKIMKKYTWANTCRKMLQTIYSPTSTDRNTSEEVTVPKPHIAIVALHPGIPNQIGRVSESLHFSLSKQFNVDYFFDGNGVFYRDMERPTFLDFLNCKVYDISHLTLRTYTKYDLIVFMLDDTSFPSRVAQRACVLPGVAIVNFSKTHTAFSKFREIALENQLNVHRIETYSYDTYHHLANYLAEDSSKLRKDANSADAAIRKGGLNRTIINKLKVLKNS